MLNIGHNIFKLKKDVVEDEVLFRPYFLIKQQQILHLNFGQLRNNKVNLVTDENSLISSLPTTSKSLVVFQTYIEKVVRAN